MILSLSLENREDKSFSTSVSLMNKKFNLIVVKIHSPNYDVRL